MSDSDNPNIDPATGLEFYFFKNQKRYRCPTMWEAGVRCHYDHYDPEEVLEHSKGAHTASGKPKPAQVVQLKRTSALVDQDGKPIVYDVPEDLQNISFKK